MNWIIEPFQQNGAFAETQCAFVSLCLLGANRITNNFDAFWMRKCWFVHTIHLLVIKFATHHNRINIVSCICTSSLDPIIMHWHTHIAHAFPRKASKISEIKLKINSVRLKWLRLSDAICIDKIDRNCVHTRNAKHFKTFCMQQPRAGGTLSFAAINAFYQHAHNRAIVWCQWQHVDVLCALIWFSMHSSVARRTSIEVINDNRTGTHFQLTQSFVESAKCKWMRLQMANNKI